MNSPLSNGFHRLGTALLAALALAVVAVPSAAQALPSDRAYEKVSPDEKNTADILPAAFAAAEGDGVAFNSFGAFGNIEGTSAAAHYFSARGDDEWILDGITPPTEPILGLGDTIPVAYGQDAATSIFQVVDREAPGNTNNTRNLIRVNPDGSETLLSIGAPSDGSTFYRSPVANQNASVVGFRTDTSMPFDVTRGPEPPAVSWNAYAGNGEDLWLVTVYPDGTPSPDGGYIKSISEDGSRIFWSATGSPEGYEIYAWNEDGPATHVTAPQRSDPDPAPTLGPKTFRYANSDASIVLFTSAAKLTDNAVDGPNLYRYDFADGGLTSLTTADPVDAGVTAVLAATEDTERIYLRSRGVLAPGGTAGAQNIYFLDGAETTYVATLDNGDPLSSATSRMSADGSTLLFRTDTQLTAYDNDGTEQLYRYDAEAEELQCVSCNPSGEPPTGDASFTRTGLGLAGVLENSRTRNLTADGSTVFFISPDALVPADTNGRFDAYIWENGPGGGSIDLLSSGTSGSDSYFVDASANGDDAYIVTRSRLVGTDVDFSSDIYDARVGGGIASQNPPPTEIPCEGEDCKPAPQDPGEDPMPGTGAVEGGSDSGERCLALDRKLERAGRKLGRTAKDARSAKAQAKRLDRKADRASGKRAKRLGRKAKQANRKAKRLRKQHRHVARTVDSLERRATRCEETAR